MRSGKTLGVGGVIGVSGQFLGALTAGIVVLGCAGGADRSDTAANGPSGPDSLPGVTTTMSSTVTSTTVSSTVTSSTAINEMVVAVFDFSSSDSAGGSTMAGWSVVNDTVMGGVSSGQLAIEDGLMIFSGELSLDNNGGFASVRSPVIESQSTQSSSMSWADRIGPRIVVQGDGRTWTVEIRTDDESGGWIASLPTSPDSITDVTIPWSSFKPVTRFLDPRDAIEPLEPSRLVSIAFYLVDGIEGPFRLGIQLIS
ncbi:MAG: hypothetical protein RL119_1884 [Actinomycetota bacterium]